MNIDPTWTRATVRASPRYTLVGGDRLSAAERARLTRVRDDDRLLRPLDSKADEWRVVGRATADLLRSLDRPRPVLEARAGIDDDHLIPRLVLDGLLEMEGPGGFVGGPRAYELLFGSDERRPSAGRRPGIQGRDRNSELSREALRYGEALRLETAPALARRLYAYNATPLSPEWAARLPTPDAVREFLGAALPAASDEAWLSWHAEVSPDPDASVYKLYVSPELNRVPEACHIVAEVFARGGPFAFKVGASLAGLLRPDKLVIYFERHDDLLAFATPLAERLAGMAAHGVPFSGGLSGDGLLSWGVDPPKTFGGARWGGESWRAWMTTSLARALIAARRAGLREISPAEYAIARLALDGVDTDTWAPREHP